MRLFSKKKVFATSVQNSSNTYVSYFKELYSAECVTRFNMIWNVVVCDNIVLIQFYKQHLKTEFMEQTGGCLVFASICLAYILLWYASLTK